MAGRGDEVPAAAAPATAAIPAESGGRAPAVRPLPRGEKTTLDPKKANVLFVDDDARLLEGLKALFRARRTTPSRWKAARGAQEIVKRIRVHVIVSDQRMPAMTGVELLRKVRATSPNTVRILLTGYTDLASLVGSINQGEIFRFVKKPWDNDELKKALRSDAAVALELATTAAPAPSRRAPRARCW